jgi:UDP-N-acetylglucosamine diphosphorylase / glucose-1-phosphate thymidylyltransferase / UDP-N-acetylgalactosamine diphosphorylase / glucosamine-1-phosphate N-acetyltransferase / galactosamine-1-phosphate N-acetyltransferase
MIAVVLARGLGTRMREPDPDAQLSEAQRRAADAGSKMMVPVHGRPFLDYVLGALADAGIADVALVVAPDHDAIRAQYAAHPPARVSLSFVVQPEALGTANAVLAAEAWTAGAPFLVMNADNLYPVAALRDLASLAEPGLTAFERDDLVRTSNIAAERILAFALVDVDDDGYLTTIIEKPGSHESEPLRRKRVFVSMNCWRFDARIFEACREVARSVRGEFELPEAVAGAARRGVRFRAIRAAGPVLDLSRRADTADIERRLAGVDPRP